MDYSIKFSFLNTVSNIGPLPTSPTTCENSLLVMFLIFFKHFGEELLKSSKTITEWPVFNTSTTVCDPI